MVGRSARVLLVFAGLVLAASLVRGAHAFRAERRSFHPRRGVVARPSDAARLGLEDVAFPGAAGSVLRGWYIPSRTGAAVVMCHGTDGDRSMMLRDARPLADAGIGVLLFDLPGHGESTGRVEFGASERVAIRNAVQYLASRTDVDPRRIGAVGFSMGAYLLAQAVSDETRLRAVVLEGAYGDANEQVSAEYRRSGLAPTLGALLATRLGMDTRALRPIDAIHAAAPRSVVIVAGTSDVTVPMALSRALYDAARQPKALWVIPGASHGAYNAVDTTYGRRLRIFFEQALTPPPAGSPPA